MFKRFRIAILLYILLFVALGQYLTARRSTDWNEPLWVDVYALNTTDSAAVQRFIDRLEPTDFESIEQFFARQAGAYGLNIAQPFRVRLAEQLDDPPPQLPARPGMVGTILWSLKMRWYVARLHWTRDGPAPDVTVFANYFDGESAAALDRSTALRKGMFAIANLYASRSQRGSNQVIIAHELLHTLGASDKYDLITTLPQHPHGFGEPDLEPLYPQSKAELMGGRIPINQYQATVPLSLSRVLIGPLTAQEIGWTD